MRINLTQYEVKLVMAVLNEVPSSSLGQMRMTANTVEELRAILGKIRKQFARERN